MTYLAAVVQMHGRPYDAATNLARTVAFIEEAAAAGARLVVLPELIVSGYDLDAARLRQVAEPIDGLTYRTWSELAARHSIWIAGGFCEAVEDRLYNSAMLVGPGGLVGHYRKLHLFDEEKLVFTPGDLGLPVYETPLGTIGLCVCYDLRFVEVARALALQGADIIAVPTAWVGGFDKTPADSGGYIGQARGAVVQANLNQVYMVCASQSGATERLNMLGSSLIADPFGEALVGPLDGDVEQIVLAPVDPATARLAQARSERIRPREDRRTDIYTVAVAGRQF